MIRITQLTFLGFYLNGALGSGKYDNISIEDVKRKIYDFTILDYLKTELGYDIDISILNVDEKKELMEEWQDMAHVIDESRKMAVEKNGLWLLVAYLLEGIQRRVPK